MNTQELIKSFSELEIAVLGDLMMDEYVWGDAARVSPESPVLVIDVKRESAVPGGAANVAANIMALGAKARIFGAVGSDAKGKDLIRTLEERGADTAGIVLDPSRPTTRKTRVVAQNQQVLRVDRESTEPISQELSQELLQRLQATMGSMSAILVSDYAKGIVNSDLLPGAIEFARTKQKPVIANGKPENARLFRGAHILSLNLQEAIATSGDKRFKTEDIRDAGAKLREVLDVETLVVTRGPKGICAWSKSGDHIDVPAHSVEVYDVAGAGDTVISVLTLATAAGATPEQAARLAVIAAAIVVGKVGVATVTADELLHHFSEFHEPTSH